jgi:hypothetical protein
MPAVPFSRVTKNAASNSRPCGSCWAARQAARAPRGSRHCRNGSLGLCDGSSPARGLASRPASMQRSSRRGRRWSPRSFPVSRRLCVWMLRAPHQYSARVNDAQCKRKHSSRGCSSEGLSPWRSRPDVLGSYFSSQITRSWIAYCSFLNKSWKMSGPRRGRVRAPATHPR